ncbi:MAG TPA: class I SAM-dependent methyltransferase [Saprospiraceae bacterium]|nr:class I SAM-dependent methyltransferase [Saprospiraceae bacterium]
MPSPFDSIARDYDAVFTHTALGQLMRQRVRDLYRTGGFGRRITIATDEIQSADKTAGTVLEINCGTGDDAIWLARQGWRVLATDISPEMVAVTDEKARQAGFGDRIESRVCSFADVEHLEGCFDLVWSNFGGLNCISPEEIERFAPVLSKKLKPGGAFVAVVMSRFCWWETLYFTLKGNGSAAFRRRSRKPVDGRLDENTTLPTWYYSPREFRSLFKNLTAERILPAGFWLPPSYLNPFFEKRPRWLQLLYFMERRCTPGLLAGASDHFFIEFEHTAPAIK